jgi:alpha-D-ribose 1-methylphosphonate 5-triphosphate synthase subunit PhnL
MPNSTSALVLEGVAKTFLLHQQGGIRLPVVSGVHLEVHPGECVVLGGPSGTGKSSVLKMIYGNYRCDAGSITVRDGNETVDVATATPRRIAALRRTSLGYVSQFLRVIPRVATLEIVASSARESGKPEAEATDRARELLNRLRVPERLWALPPATFSGGEQQRINIARGLAAERPILLLDEPTASLDATNRANVVELLSERKADGVALLGIFHDEDVRDRIADRVVDITQFST